MSFISIYFYYLEIAPAYRDVQQIALKKLSKDEDARKCFDQLKGIRTAEYRTLLKFDGTLLDDIVNEWCRLFPICTDGDVDSGRTNIDKQSLVSGLQKHGGDIKSTIQELNQQADKLRNQVHELQGQKQGLVEQNQKMLSIIAYSDPVVKFLQGSDHSFSNDNDNVKILATIAFTLYILYFHYGGIKRLADDDDLNKLFVRLSRAFAAGGEESVSIREVKPAVAKVLDALIAKLNSYKLQANEDIALDVIRDCVSNGSDLPTNSKLEGMSS